MKGLNIWAHNSKKRSLRTYKITYLILIPARPNFYRPPQRILLLLRVRSSDPLPNILKICSRSEPRAVSR